MSVPTNIRVKAILLLTKFESATIVERKRKADFGKNTLKRIALYQHFNAFVTAVLSKIENVPRDIQQLQKISTKKLTRLSLVNHTRVLSTLQDLFLSEIRELHEVRSVIYQRDGAPRISPPMCDTISLINFLTEGLEEVLLRPAPRSPDLISLDFHLCWHCNNNVYKSPIKDMDKFKTIIVNEIKSISKTIFSNIFSNIMKGMELCISVGEDHFEYLL